MALPAFRVAQTLSGNSAFVKTYTSNGAITKDTFVVVEAGGTVAAASNGDSLISGLALETVATGETVRVVLATPDVMFSGNVSTGAPFATADIGSRFEYETTGVNLGTAGGPLVCYGLDETDSTAAAGTRVLFQVAPSNDTDGAIGVPGTQTASA